MERLSGRWRIGAEVVPVLLVIACVGGALGLVISAHRRWTVRPRPIPQAVVAAAPSPTPAPPTKPTPKVEPEPEIDATPPEDPTPKVLAELARQTEEERRLSSEAGRLAKNLSEAIEKAHDETNRWRRRHALVKKQVDSLDLQAKRLEDEADDLAKLRDALEIEREMAKTEVAKARSASGLAILPYKGTNGTWRRPISIECVNGGAKLQPHGPSFSLSDLSESEHGALSNPLLSSVAKTAININRDASPDGAGIVPYLLFLIRPDGVRAYYEARARLELLGIAFGYELVDQDAELTFPDLNDRNEWRDALGTPESAPGGPSQRQRQTVADAPGIWPTDRPAPEGEGEGSGSAWSRLNDPRVRSPRGTYANSALVRGQPDPRQLRAIAEGRADDAANDGRIELFPHTPGMLPSFAPTPSSGAETPDGGDEWRPSTGRRTGGPSISPPSRSLPAPGRMVESGAIGSSYSATETAANPGGAASGSAMSPGRLGGSITPEGRGAPYIGGNADLNAASGAATSASAKDAKPLTGARAGGSDLTPLTVVAPADSGGVSGELTSSNSVPQGRENGTGSPGMAGSKPLGAPASSSERGTPRAGSLGMVGSGISEGADSSAGGGQSTNAATLDPPPPTARAGSALNSAGRSMGRGTTSSLTSRTWSEAGGGNPPSNSDVPPLPTAPGLGLSDPISGSAAVDGDIAQAPARPGGSDSQNPPVPDNGSQKPANDPSTASNRTKKATPGSESSSSSTNSQSQDQKGSSGPGSAGSGMAGSGSKSVEVPPTIWIEPTKRSLEITVACGPKGVTIQPGGYRYRTQTIATLGSPLVNTLRVIERNHRLARPKETVQPRVIFVLEPGGQAAYSRARGIYLASGLNWPTTFRISEGDSLHVYGREEW
jgi:hypothetical protein